MTTKTYRPQPGFQSSEHTSCDVLIYPKDTDPLIRSGTGEGIVKFEGRTARDPNGAILQVSTTKTMGAAAGTWEAMLKPSLTQKDPDLLNRLVDDDWVDIVFTRHGRRWHVMRGFLEDVRRQVIVAGNGATTEVIRLSGRDFAKVWEQTPIWFNVFDAVNVAGAVAQKVYSGVAEVTGPVDVVVLGLLKGFLQELGELGRANWVPPALLPNIRIGSFVDSIQFKTENFIDVPSRIAVTPSFMQPRGTLWQLAQQWSDPELCELFADLALDDNRPIDAADTYSEKDTRMRVTLRDKPFPQVHPDLIRIGSDSAWFELPLYIVPPESIVNADIGRSGAERFNAFFASCPLEQEALQANAVEMRPPLWDPIDIETHGMRRFDLNTQYTAAPNTNLYAMVETMRYAIRDWYCLNPYFRSGTLALGHGRPDIRIGSRVRVPSPYGEEKQTTYYVESVAHSWVFGTGARTSLGVTRGWEGTDRSILDALNEITARYEVPEPKQPGT